MMSLLARRTNSRWAPMVALALSGFLSAGSVEARPDTPPAPPPGAAVLRREGRALLRQGNLPAAIQKLRAAADLEPTRWESLDALLVVYIRTGAYTGRKVLTRERSEHLRKRLGNLFLPTRARATELSDMGTTYRMIDMQTAAERCYLESLALQEKRRDLKGQAILLADLGDVYKAAGNPAKAETFARRAVELNEQTRGPTDPETAATISILAKVLEAEGRYAEAEPLYERALHIREKVRGPDHLDIADSLNDMGVFYQRMGRYAKAVPMVERALAIYRKKLGAAHPTIITSLNNLACLYVPLQDFAKAQSLLEQALATQEKVLGPNHRDTAQTLHNLAMLFRAEGLYAKAEPLHKRELAINEKTLGPEHPATAGSLNTLASLYQETGRYGEAQSLLERALAITEKSLGPQHPDVAQSLNSLAGLYQARGDYAKAAPLFERVLSIDEKALGADHPWTGAACSNLASFYEGVGNYAKAESLYQRALAISEKTFGPTHPSTAFCLNTLAMLYKNMGDYAKSESLYVRALAINEKTLGPEHPATASNLTGLALLYLAMNKDDRAEPLLTRALAIIVKKMGSNHPSTASALNNLALIRNRAGDFAQSETLYRQALAIDEKTLGPENPVTAQVLNNLAILQMDRNDPAEGGRLALRAEEAGERTLANVLSFSPEAQRREFEQTHAPYNIPATLGDAPLIARTLLHWKGVVLDSVIEDRAVARATDTQGTKQQLETIRDLKSQVFKLTLEAPKTAREPELRSRTEQREKLGRELEETEAALARQVGALGRTRRALEVTAEQVQSALGPREALVEFIRYNRYLGKQRWETHYGAVVFTPQGPLQWVPLGAAADIDKAVRFYQKSARRKTDEVALQAALHGLCEELWTPIEKTLPDNTDRVILSPDGELNFVSFATLLGGDDRFLAERYTLRYVSSGRDLLREPEPAAGSLVAAFGNPDFGAGGKPGEVHDPEEGNPQLATRGTDARNFAGVRLPPLPGTARECAALETLAGTSGAPCRLFLGADATERSLREVRSPRVLHLATHGFFLPKPGGAPGPGVTPAEDAGADRNRQLFLSNPMRRSGLALAGAQGTLAGWARGAAPPGDNDGVVTAEEVGDLKLEGTWLVALSACDTGAGEATAGEGVLGLRRGFIQAGAQNLLMTLWPISDETTVRIMLDFYARAFHDGDAPEALADTQRQWLVTLRKERGLVDAVNLAGAFIISSQGRQ